MKTDDDLNKKRTIIREVIKSSFFGKKSDESKDVIAIAFINEYEADLSNALRNEIRKEERERAQKETERDSRKNLYRLFAEGAILAFLISVLAGFITDMLSSIIPSWIGAIITGCVIILGVTAVLLMLETRNK